eukprot:10103210-Alexandrium_andersonii.AAC.1
MTGERMRLVINCTTNTDRPSWMGKPGVPAWIRFEVAGDTMKSGRPSVCICGRPCGSAGVWACRVV